MAELDARIVSTAEAATLLMFESPADLQKLARDGWIKPDGPDRWRLVPLVQGFARWAKHRATVSTTAELAACWGVTKQRVGQVAAEGWFKPLEGRRGMFNWADANAGYIRSLKDEGRRTSKSAAESRVRDARAREIEVRVAERERVLIPTSDAVAAMELMCGLARTEFEGLPPRITRDLSERDRLDQEVDGSLSRLARRLGQVSRALRSGQPVAQAFAPDDTGSVGEGE